MTVTGIASGQLWPFAVQRKRTQDLRETKLSIIVRRVNAILTTVTHIRAEIFEGILHQKADLLFRSKV